MNSKRYSKKYCSMYVKNVVIIIILIYSNLTAQTLQNNFIHYSQKDGLPSNDVHSMIQDHLGYIWIGTSNGLTRYDGYEFHNFSIVNNDSNFLQLPLTTALFEDSKRNLWIGSVGGITKYDRVKETFKLYDASIFGAIEQKDFAVNSIQETTEGDILLGIRNFYYSEFKKGLFIIKSGSDKIEYVDLVGDDSTNAILQISPLKENRFLICGFRGLGEYNHAEKSISWYPIKDGETVTSMLLDENKKVWLGIHRVGIYNYNLSDSTFERFHIPKRPELENENLVIWQMIYDQNNNIIMASGQGIIQLDILEKTSVYADYDLQNPSALHSYRFKQIMRDKTGLIWLGSSGLGISKYNSMKNRIRSYNHLTNDAQSITPGWVGVIFEFSENELWFISQSESISVFNKITRKFKNLPHPPNTSIESIIRDNNGQIWAAGYNTF